MSDIVFDRFNPPGDEGIDCSGDEVRTQQEFKDEVDINRMMARVIGGAELPPDLSVGTYGDFSEVLDYRASLDAVRRAEQQFAAMPAKVRDRFHNDPAEFLAWVHDPATKLEEANELGLLSEEAKKRLTSVPEGTVKVETLKTAT